MTKILTPTPALKAFGDTALGASQSQDFSLASTGTVATKVTAARIVGDADFAVDTMENAERFPVTVSLGKIWEYTDCNLPPRAAFGFVKAGSNFYVVGGVNDTDVFNDCWRSTDGIEWIRMTDAAFDKGRSGLALFVVGDSLVAVGGLVEGVATDEIWTSADFGVTWTKSASVFPQKVARMGYCQSNSLFLMFGGIDHTTALNDKVSTSADGTTWTQSGGHATARSDCAFMRVASGAYAGYYIMCGDDQTAPLLDDCWFWNGDGAVSFANTTVAPFGGVPKLAPAAIAIGENIAIHGGATDIADAPGTATGAVRYSADGGASWSTIFTTDTRMAYHAAGLISSTQIALVGGLGSWPEVL